MNFSILLKTLDEENVKNLMDEENVKNSMDEENVKNSMDSSFLNIQYLGGFHYVKHPLGRFA